MDTSRAPAKHISSYLKTNPAGRLQLCLLSKRWFHLESCVWEMAAAEMALLARMTSTGARSMRQGASFKPEPPPPIMQSPPSASSESASLCEAAGASGLVAASACRTGPAMSDAASEPFDAAASTWLESLIVKEGGPMPTREELINLGAEMAQDI